MVYTTLPFELKSDRKYTLTCPKCGEKRHKTQTKSLTVYRDPDGYVRWECSHAGQCEWNERQFMKDPEPNEVQHTNEEVVIARDIKDLPAEINNHKVWWYKNTEGLVLFGVKRFNGTKIFTPVIPTDSGFIDKGVSWPNVKTLFNADKIKDHNRVMVVEGEKTAEAASKMFPKTAVVTWRGGANNISSADWRLLEGKEVWLWPDNDEPGKAVMEKIGKELPVNEYKVVYVDHLEKGQDLADNLSLPEIQEAYDKAETRTNRRSLINLDRLIEQHNRINKRLVTGWEDLDNNIKFPMTGLVTIEARTKNGKSAVSVFLMQKLVENGKNVVYYSYEMPSSRLIGRYLRIYKPETDLQDIYLDPVVDDKRLEIETIELHDQDSQLPANLLLNQLDSPSMFGKVVFIDYLQIVPMKGSERQVLIKNLLDSMRVLANKHGFIIFMLSQLTPDYSNPVHDAPREAKDIHFSSDMVIRLWNKEQEYDHPVYDSTKGNYIIHVTHNRDGESGAVLGFNFSFGVSFEFVEKGDKVQVRRKQKDNDAEKKLNQIIELMVMNKGVI